MAWEQRTERLVARAPRRHDREAYFQLLRDPAVEEWLRPQPLKPFREVEIRNLLLEDKEHWVEHGFGPWAIVEGESGELVGRGGLCQTELEGVPAVEMPWAIRSDHWGRGYATEAANAAVAWARSLRLKEIVALILPRNLASLRVAEKAGLEASGSTIHAGLEHLVFKLKL